MRVYVETNFVLEVARKQEQSAACEALMALAEREKARLVIPAYCLIEPYEASTRTLRERRALLREIERQRNELVRSLDYGKKARSVFGEALTFLARTELEEERRLRALIQKINAVAEVIPLSNAVVDGGLWAQREGFGPQDAIVYASILEHLSGEHQSDCVFLNRNSKDFGSPEVVTRLGQNRCKLLFDFEHGIRYVRSKLSS